jgi:methyltransferase (TIGR00027 family)
MALFRALESVGPPGARLFHDPFAIDFLRPALRAAVAAARTPALGRLIPWLIDCRWPGARSSGVARTRLIDDALADAVRRGTRQVAILGAGFDCRAYRLPALGSVRVFEVDHPQTQAAKRNWFERRFGHPPAAVAFAAVDFDRQSLAEGLTAVGFDAAALTFFVWEGVTNYLTEPAIDSTLRFIGSIAPGSRILFTYVHRGLIDGTSSFPGTGRLTRTLRRVGERWTFGLEPAEVPAYLAARGLRLIEDLGAREYRARYLPGGAAIRGYEFYRAALAEAVPRQSSPRSPATATTEAEASAAADPARDSGSGRGSASTR